MTPPSATHRAALAYAAKGIAVFPIVAAGTYKQPATDHGLKDATTDVAQINAWWTDQPAFNIGIATGAAATFVVVDVDGPEGAASLAALEAAHGSLPETPEQTTARGRHICFAYDAERPIKNSQSRHVRMVEKHGPDPRAKIDVRGDGGYIVAAPSQHQSGVKYTWHAERRPSRLPFAPMPEWLRAVLEWKPPKLAAVPAAPKPQLEPASRPAPGGKLITPYGEAALRDECDKIEKAQPGTRENTVNTSAFVIGTLVGGGEISETVARAALIDAAMRMTGDHTLTEAAEKIERALSQGQAQPRSAPPKPERYRPAPPPPPIAQARTTEQAAPEPAPAKITDIASGRGYTDDTLWEREIIRKDDSGGVHPKRVKNAILFLTHHPEMRGVLAFDEFARRVVMVKRPAWEAEDGTEWTPRSISDNDAVLATAWLETRGICLNAPTVHSAAVAAANFNPFNPAIDWLDSLKWDGEKRLDGWLNYYLGADDTAYTRAVGRKWWIGAAARIMRPGCKMDTMLILEGDQGIRKSGAARIIGTFSGVSYFTDEISEIGSKDAAMQLQGVSIIEIPELNAFGKADMNAIKAWLTRTTDRYRPPYGRSVIEAPRQCVLIGTMNPDGAGYFDDVTGARRFWPVPVTSCDVDALGTDQPQLWAEALAEYRAGAAWWLDLDETAPALSEQADRYVDDPWADAIDDYIGLLATVRIESLRGDGCLKIPPERQTQQVDRRIARHLKRKGWTRAKVYDPHARKAKWTYSKPKEEESEQ